MYISRTTRRRTLVAIEVALDLALGLVRNSISAKARANESQLSAALEHGGPHIAAIDGKGNISLLPEVTA